MVYSLKKYIFSFFIIISLFFLFTSDVSAENYEYNITNYDIDVVVNENNTLYITEKIGAYFNVHKHGIFRKIPLKNEVNRLDGTTSRNRAKISEIEVSDQYSLSTENGYKVIKIGDPNYTLTGPKNYEIRYLYNLGKDTGKEYDELYFNLIGSEWDTSISNITFTITMPKEFDSSKLGFSSGRYGSVDSSKIIYDVQGNVITGSYRGILNSGEALTVRLELPEGYFVNARMGLSSYYFWEFLIPVIGVLISYILWKIYGRDDQVVETVEFYPPKGLNSLDVGFLYDGYADDTDVTSLLIYLANKGYLKIAETDNGSVLFSNGFVITKLKDYDGNNIHEKLFFDGLFKNDEIVDPVKVNLIMDNAKKNGEIMSFSQAKKLAKDKVEMESVTQCDLYNRFYVTMDKIKDDINNKENKDLIFEKNRVLKYSLIILFIIVTFITVFFVPVLDYEDSIELVAPSFICLFFTLFFLGVIFTDVSLRLKIILLVFLIVFLILLLISLPFGEFIICDSRYIIGMLFGMICNIVMVVIFSRLPRRTKYGNEMLGKINAFKNFLEVAEKEKLESMVMLNSTYFYDILPYAYVLGVSKKWIEKFESISLQAPDWYDGDSSFDSETVYNFINKTMYLVSETMTSYPEDSYSDSDYSNSISS